jgi:hypothetical protein
MRRLFSAATAFVAVFGANTEAQAAVVYEYTGHLYTSVNTGLFYDLTERLSGTFVVDSPLAANLALTDIRGYSGFDFAFDDGGGDVSSYTANAFQIATNSAGEISAWHLELNAYSHECNPGGCKTFKGDVVSDSISGDTVFRLDQLTIEGGLPGVYGGADGASAPSPLSWAQLGEEQPETIWRIVSGDTTVPEPATLALFGLGLAGLGAVRRKKLAA